MVAGGVRRKLLGVLLWTALLLVMVQYCLVAPRAGLRTNQNKDFSHLWIGGRMIVSGHAGQLYNPSIQKQAYRDADSAENPPAVWLERNEVVGCFFYPPPTAVAYSALAWMPMRTAAIVQAYLNIVLGVLIAWYFARRIHGGVPVAAAGLAILVYPPYFVTVALGQNSVVTMGLVLFAWGMCNRRRDFGAGLLLGLLICKPNWLLAIGWIPLIHRRWGLLMGMVCGATAVVGGSILVTGVEPFLSYTGLLRSLAGLHEMDGYNLKLTYNGLSVFRKWLGAGTAVELLGWCSSAIMVVVTWRVTRGQWKPGTMDFQRLMGCCLIASLWINPHLFYYDLVLTVACIMLMGAAWPQLDRRGRTLTAALIILGYLAIPLDDHCSWGHLIPIPSFATLAIWLWFCWHILSERRRSLQRSSVFQNA